MKEAKQVIVMRKDLNMRKGKMVSQGAHASLGAVLSLMEHNTIFRNPEIGNSKNVFVRTLSFEEFGYLDHWLNGIFTKITVGVDSLEELEEIYDKAFDANMPRVKITDAGLTEFNGVPTITCIAVGPYWSTEIDEITGHLKLL